ncbi:MAG: hypothetical protein ACQCN6_14855 [Candidatus Bathyarchaeia archaeon]
MSDASFDNTHIVEAAEERGIRFCPVCGNRMKTCCEVHRQYNLSGHRPNGVHKAPEEWICLNCGIREYKELAMRIMCGLAGTV